jgi:uncharacterized protein (UPF0147 family)
LRQCACGERKRTNLAVAQQYFSVGARREELESTIVPREVSRGAQAILTSIQIQLSVLKVRRAKEAVLLKVISNKNCTNNLPGEVTKKDKAICWELCSHH